MADPLAYLRQREEDKSRGVAWAQRCLEGENENLTLPHEGGRAAEDMLRECGWERLEIKFRGLRPPYGTRRGGTPSTKCTYQSPDGRFRAVFSYSRLSLPMCWCGFEKAK